MAVKVYALETNIYCAMTISGITLNVCVFVDVFQFKVHYKSDERARGVLTVTELKQEVSAISFFHSDIHGSCGNFTANSFE